MNDEIAWQVELAVKPSELDNFRALTRDMVAFAKTEPGVLVYERFGSEDGATVYVYERFADSASTLPCNWSKPASCRRRGHGASGVELRAVCLRNAKCRARLARRRDAVHNAALHFGPKSFIENWLSRPRACVRKRLRGQAGFATGQLTGAWVSFCNYDWYLASQARAIIRYQLNTVTMFDDRTLPTASHLAHLRLITPFE